MKSEKFFSRTRPGEKLKIGNLSVELPILYLRDDLFTAFFTCSLKRVREILPSEKLKPVSLGLGRAVVGIGCFNYIDTSIGPYGEVGVIIPVVHNRLCPPVFPLLLEANYPSLGFLVMHLPVTALAARNAGRGIWGYTKFTTEMNFEITPEASTCEMSEGGKNILRLTVKKKGMVRRDNRPLVTYSVLNRELIYTNIPTRAIYLTSVIPSHSELVLGDHPVANTIRALEPSKKALMSRLYVERSGILPRGEVVETGVKPMDGYPGGEQEGKLTVTY